MPKRDRSQDPGGCRVKMEPVGVHQHRGKNTSPDAKRVHQRAHSPTFKLSDEWLQEHEGKGHRHKQHEKYASGGATK